MQGPGTGIDGATCMITSDNPNVTDFVPVLVETVQFFELNLDLEALNIDFRLDMELEDGDTISFTSKAAEEPGVILGGLFIRLAGVNAQGQPVQLQWVVKYANICDSLAFYEGDSIGWTEFEALSDPPPNRCDASLSVTRPPTGPTGGSVVPTAAPSRTPSDMFLSVAPSPILVPAPSSLPSIAPSLPCDCSPQRYRWILDFNSTCDNNRVVQGPDSGIAALDCQIYQQGGNDDSASSNSTVVDLTPRVVTTVQVFELGSSLTALKSKQLRNQSLVDGDEITYDSITLDDPTVTPHGFFIRLVGVNDAGAEIVSQWVVRYTQQCEALVFRSGEQLGWTLFDQLGSPPEDRCLVGNDRIETGTTDPIEGGGENGGSVDLVIGEDGDKDTSPNRRTREIPIVPIVVGVATASAVALLGMGYAVARSQPRRNAPAAAASAGGGPENAV
jgi:hypothetical protein